MNDYLYDHYKTTNQLLKEAAKERDRYFLLTIVFILGLGLLSVYPQQLLSFINESIEQTANASLELSYNMVQSSTWLVLLWNFMRYCQKTIYIERQYKYIAKIEEQLKIFRESKEYENEYPLVLSLIHRIYQWVFPIIIVISIVAKLIWEYIHRLELIFLVVDTGIATLTLLIVLLFCVFLHSGKKGKKTMKRKIYKLLFGGFVIATVALLVWGYNSIGSEQAFATCAASIAGGAAASIGVAWAVDRAIERENQIRTKGISEYLLCSFYRSVLIYMDSLCATVVKDAQLSPNEKHNICEWINILCSTTKGISENTAASVKHWISLIRDNAQKIVDEKTILISFGFIDTTENEAIMSILYTIEIMSNVWNDISDPSCCEDFKLFNMSLLEALEQGTKLGDVKMREYSKASKLLCCYYPENKY